jgi:hypothetical protein
LKLLLVLLAGLVALIAVLTALTGLLVLLLLTGLLPALLLATLLLATLLLATLLLATALILLAALLVLAALILVGIAHKKPLGLFELNIQQPFALICVRHGSTFIFPLCSLNLKWNFLGEWNLCLRTALVRSHHARIFLGGIQWG